MFRPGSPQDINVTSIHEADLGVVARVAIEAANTIQDLALSSEDPALGPRYAEELKVLLKSYIGCYASARC
jgi:hypothetical protein